MKLFHRLKQWYQGEYVVWKNDPGDPVMLIGGQHLLSTSAKITRAIIHHLAKEWKWWIGTAIAITGLAFSWKRSQPAVSEKLAPALKPPDQSSSFKGPTR